MPDKWHENCCELDRDEMRKLEYICRDCEERLIAWQEDLDLMHELGK